MPHQTDVNAPRVNLNNEALLIVLSQLRAGYNRRPAPFPASVVLCGMRDLRVWPKGKPDPLAEGLRQLDSYLDRLSLDTGVLVVFDRRPGAAPVAERTAFEEATSPSGRPITVLRA